VLFTKRINLQLQTTRWALNKVEVISYCWIPNLYTSRYWRG